MEKLTDFERLFVVVAAALVDPGGRVLVQRRPEGKPLAGLWEFPGGKVDPGETPEDALARELAEELGVRVAPAALAPVTFASEPLGTRQLLLLLYCATDWAGVPEPRHASALRWLAPHDLSGLAMPPADHGFPDALQRHLAGRHPRVTGG